MNKALKIFIIILALPIILLGLKTMIDPVSMIAKWGIDPIGNTGLNNLRSMFPGILLGSGVMMIFGVLRKDTTWFLATAFVMLVVAFGRILSFGLDGFDIASVPPVIYELFAATVMIFAHKRLKDS